MNESFVTGRLLRFLPPELAHRMVIYGLRHSHGLQFPKVPTHAALQQCLFGLDFSHPLGLAAGFDKNAEVIAPMLRMGLSFVEVGTVTPRPQAGNPRPRVFRVPEVGGVINRLGFNNWGVDEAARQLEKYRERPELNGVVGVNIGKNKDTPLNQAPRDYYRAAEKLSFAADYLTVNLSSPNTPELRRLQFGQALKEILQATDSGRRDNYAGKRPPILVKLAPDLHDDEITELSDQLLKLPVSGVILTNTTIARGDLPTQYSKMTGGLSGRPLFQASTQVLAKFYQRLQGRRPIIGVGGIFSGGDALAKIEAGATLVQVYTGLIYRGPHLINETLEHLNSELERQGKNHIQELVGQRAASWAADNGQT